MVAHLHLCGAGIKGYSIVFLFIGALKNLGLIGLIASIQCFELCVCGMQWLW